MNSNWHKGYKEVKNTIHNDIGITKEEILEVFRQVTRDEIGKIISEKSDFIYNTFQKVIRDEMVKVVYEHKYPKVMGTTWYYGRSMSGETHFKDFVSGVMKEEIVDNLRKQFEIDLNIERKGE